MKQHITEDQLNELSDEGKIKLNEWYNKKPHEYLIVGICADGTTNKTYQQPPLLTIGQMIEFLDGNFINFWRGKRDDWLIIIDDDKHIVKKELVDALWDAVKEVLNENTT
jgi:hypothetical protein